LRSLYDDQWNSKHKGRFGLSQETADFAGFLGHNTVDSPILPEHFVELFQERTLHRTDVRPWHSKAQGAFQGIRAYSHIPLATRCSFMLEESGQILRTRS
jgi:hypothetical protein